MSKRRSPGEIVQRCAGSGFCGSEEPRLIRVPDGKAYENDFIRNPETGDWMENIGGSAQHCMMGCGDPECREWPNLEIVSGPHAGKHMYHISECQMLDSENTGV